MSFVEDGYRTGYPNVCPLGRPGKTTKAEACAGCELSVRDERSHWRCDHPNYQNASGIHFCTGCGIELGPYFERYGWETCGGPTGICRYDEVEPEFPTYVDAQGREHAEY